MKTRHGRRLVALAPVFALGASACVGAATLPDWDDAPDVAVEDTSTPGDTTVPGQDAPPDVATAETATPQDTSSTMMPDAAGPDETSDEEPDGGAEARSVPLEAESDEAGDATMTVATEAGLPKVSWDQAESTEAEGVFPAVAAGPGLAGSWMVQCQQHYPDKEFELEWQSGTTTGVLGPASIWTANAKWAVPPPGSGLVAMSSGGSLFEVASPAAPGGPLYWFTGQLDATETQVSWPNGNEFQGGLSGYRPRLSSTWLGAGDGSVGVAVYMASSSPGPLDFLTLGWTDLADASPVSGYVSYWSGATTYDPGFSQNPAVALGPAVGATAAVVEVHQDPSTNLFYRLGTISTAGAAITWSTSASAYPGGEQGAHPAVVIYGATLLEVHEGTGGDLRWMTGTLTPSGGLTWDGPSEEYEAAGADPAIAVDPTTGLGVEVHDSAARDGTLTRRAFRVENQ